MEFRDDNLALSYAGSEEKYAEEPKKEGPDLFLVEKQKAILGKKEIEIIADLNLLLDRCDCEITSSDIESLNRGLSTRILRYSSRDEKGNVDWKKIKENLTKNNQWKLVIPEVGERRTFEVAVMQLDEILLSQDNLPEIITSKYIEKVASKQFAFFGRYVKNKNNYIDWEKIVENSKVLKGRFDFPKRIEEHVPSEKYENAEEVEDALEPYKHKLYTFFELMDDGDSDIRNEICKILINLAKKGNDLAKERLILYVKPIIEHWIDEEPGFYTYKSFTDVLENRIERCIYLYEGKAKFLNYLKKSLSKQKRGLNVRKKGVHLYK